MDKKELKHDIVNERLIGIVEYLNENKIIAFQVVFALLAIISLSTWYTVSNKNYNKASIESLQKAYLSSPGTDEGLISQYQDILDNYPGTDAADYAVAHLIRDALVNDNDSLLNKLLFEHDFSYDNDIFSSLIDNLRGDYHFNNEEYNSAIEYYSKAIDKTSIEEFSTEYKINKIRAFIMLNDLTNARKIVDGISLDGVSNQAQKNTLKQLDVQLLNIM